MSSRAMRRGAYRVSNYASAIWAIYKAGKISYSLAKKAVGMSSQKQKAFVQRYKRGTNLKTKDVMKLKKQVRTIQKVLNTDLSTRTYRQRDTNQVLAASNSKASRQITFTVGQLETAISTLRYYSESTGAYVTQSPTGTASHDIRIHSLYDRVLARNNFTIPCYVEMYLCVPKRDTSILPVTAFTNGMTDQGNPNPDSPLLYLTDSDQFNDIWSIKSSSKKIVMPGNSVKLTYTSKPFDYNSSLFDSHALDYQSAFKSHVFVIRVTGIVGHGGSTTTTVAVTQSGLDIIRDMTVVVKYDGGGPAVNDIAVVDNSDTFGGNGTITEQPIAANLNYSAV